MKALYLGHGRYTWLSCAVASFLSILLFFWFLKLKEFCTVPRGVYFHSSLCLPFASSPWHKLSALLGHLHLSTCVTLSMEGFQSQLASWCALTAEPHNSPINSSLCIKTINSTLSWILSHAGCFSISIKQRQAHLFCSVDWQNSWLCSK